MRCDVGCVAARSVSNQDTVRHVHTSHHECQLTGVFLDNSKTGVGTLLPSSVIKDSIIHALFILLSRLCGYFTVSRCLYFEKHWFID